MKPNKFTGFSEQDYNLLKKNQNFVHPSALNNYQKKLKSPDGVIKIASNGNITLDLFRTPSQLNSGTDIVKDGIYLVKCDGTESQSSFVIYLEGEPQIEIVDLNGDAISDYYLYQMATWYKCVSKTSAKIQYQIISYGIPV